MRQSLYLLYHSQDQRKAKILADGKSLGRSKAYDQGVNPRNYFDSARHNEIWKRSVWETSFV